jgi:hypothetical protein
MEVSMGKIIANGGFPGKIVGNCGENMGKPLGFKGEINYTCPSLRSLNIA